MKGPRWFVVGIGAIIVAALFSFPLWRQFIPSGSNTGQIFPQLPDNQREILLKIKDRGAAATAYVAALTPAPAPTSADPPPQLSDSVTRGRFRGLDAFHQAAGTVRLYRLPDQSLLVRLEDGFRVTNAPNLILVLSPNGEPVTPESLDGPNESRFVVGELLGNSGDQTFTLPAQLRIERYRSVVIVSRALNTLYGVAPLQ